MTCPVPLARKMVLQVAVRDIGQLTDICERNGTSAESIVRRPAPGRARTPRT
jgi:hypothetical protein